MSSSIFAPLVLISPPPSRKNLTTQNTQIQYNWSNSTSQFYQTSHLTSTLKHGLDLSRPELLNILKEINPDVFIPDCLPLRAGEVSSFLDIPTTTFITFNAVATSFLTTLFHNTCSEYPFSEIYLHGYEKAKLLHHLADEAARSKDDKLIREEATNDHDDNKKGSKMSSFSNNVILIKSSREVEGKYLDFYSGLLKKKVLPTCPLIEDHDDEPVHEEDSVIIEWLKKKEKSSTVYHSFGSEYFLLKEEIEEISLGLELSKVNFIWTLRFPVGEERTRRPVSEVLPEGFLQRVGEKGLVVEGWAPQTKILKHESIGGFVSHCGWSSLLESMKHGVPVIALPMQIDQPFNARLVVEVIVCVEVVREKNSDRIERDAVAKAVREVVVEEAGKGVRKKAREIGAMLRAKGDEEIDQIVKEFVKIKLETKIE